MNTEEVGVVSLCTKSCAALTIQCLSDAGIDNWQSAFIRLIENAKALGLMPDDNKVVQVTLKYYGFIMQSTHLKDIRLYSLRNELKRHGESAIIFVQLSDYKHLGGKMIAIKKDGCNFHLISPREDSFDNIKNSWIVNVWMRWSDGIDKSPFPRRTVKRTKCDSSQRESEKETAHYKPFQPNPQKNCIGDCVVRAVSGAMDIPWTAAIDLLATEKETTINARDVYPRILEQKGFIHHAPIKRNGRHLKGNEFCDEMSRVFHCGERIFAHVGRLHVAAIVPLQSDSETSYKIIDSWNSSEQSIGEYWVSPQKTACDDSNSNLAQARTFTVGDKLSHPSFGIGNIISLSAGIMTIDFGEKGIRRLGEAWVLANC